MYKEEIGMVEKQKRILLYENDDLVLEQRNNKYFLSFYDKDGTFRREVTIVLQEDFKVTTCNGM